MIQIDMDMPEKCGLCPLFHAEHPMHCQGVKADRKKKIVAPYGQPRPEWCPLNEVTADPDTVSRKEVLDAVNALTKWTLLDRFDRHVGVGVKYYEVKEAVKDLPPSPSRPHGHWKFVHPLQEDDPGAYICSECGTGDWKIDPTEDRFCKFCGSDNREDGEKGAP